ncbi:DUF945 family protein [uncultured Thiodictyon sp.]|uniref:DUF945 family protein n=1 Tax=uncultured Thiodictyon sp. TaxID=1846217 RepID=UPI0025FEC24F|nr:DUF945 family protein [uncultured Thiodictyon sp.]
MKPLNRIVKGVLIALTAILVLVPIALPRVLGASAQRAYQDLLRSAVDSLPAGWVLVERYDRGWFRSHATAELTRQTADHPVFAPGLKHIRLDSRIDQGPWAWLSAGFGGGPFPVAARVRTRVEWIDAPLPLPPLILTTSVGANGAGRTHLLIPAPDQTTEQATEEAANQTQPRDAYRLHGKTITGTVDFSLNPRQAQVDLRIPDLALSNPAGPAASLTDAQLRAQLTDWAGGLFSGYANLDIAAARFTAAPQAGSQTGAPPNETILERLTLRLDQVPEGEAPTLRLGLRLNASAQQLRLRGNDYQSPVIGLSAQSLDVRTLTEIIFGVRILMSDTATPAERGVAGLTLVAQVLPRFLAAGPSIKINPLTMSTTDGPVAGHLAIAAVNHGSGSNGTAALLGALLGGGPETLLSGDGELALPRPVAVNWLAGTDTAARSAATAQLQEWIDGGWVTASDNRVTSALRIDRGKLTINGKRAPLRFSAGR